MLAATYRCGVLQLLAVNISGQHLEPRAIAEQPGPPPSRSCRRNYGGPRRLVITIQGQRRADGRKYSSYR